MVVQDEVFLAIYIYTRDHQDDEGKEAQCRPRTEKIID